MQSRTPAPIICFLLDETATDTGRSATDVDRGTGTEKLDVWPVGAAAADALVAMEHAHGRSAGGEARPPWQRPWR
jgi:hypothetical protein